MQATRPRQEQSKEWRMGKNYRKDSKDSSDTVGCKPNVNPQCHVICKKSQYSATSKVGIVYKICEIILSFYSALIKALAWMQSPGLGTTAQQQCGPAGVHSDWIRAGWSNISKTTTSEAGAIDELCMLKKKKEGRGKKLLLLSSDIRSVMHRGKGIICHLC